VLTSGPVGVGTALRRGRNCLVLTRRVAHVEHIGEGFDAPALDTLFLAAPVSYDGLLVQCAGRVIGAAPADVGKDDAFDSVGSG
jgi:superfamily II DNA or RNA helicase